MKMPLYGHTCRITGHLWGVSTIHHRSLEESPPKGQSCEALVILWPEQADGWCSCDAIVLAHIYDPSLEGNHILTAYSIHKWMHWRNIMLSTLGIWKLNHVWLYYICTVDRCHIMYHCSFCNRCITKRSRWYHHCLKRNYHQASYTRRTFVGNKIVDHWTIVGHHLSALL